VVITRARKKLFYYCVQNTRSYGYEPFPFLGEIPYELIVYLKEEGPVTREEADFFAAIKEKFKA
jgi:hypothetical protein